MIEQPLTEESLRQALQQFYDIGNTPESAPRKPIPRAYYEERKRHFESTGDEARLEVLRICYEPVDLWDEEQP